MDRITEWFFSKNNGIFDPLARAINEPILFVGMVIAATFLLEPKNDKRVKILVAVLMATILGLGLKEAYGIERPCAFETGKVTCPNEYSFPSIHAAVAFTFMIAFLNKKIYPVLIVGALVIAISRMYLGVHTFEDIVGGLIVAPFAYAITSIGWEIYGKRN